MSSFVINQIKNGNLQDTANILFGTNITSEDDIEKWLKKKRPIYDHEPRNGEEISLSRVGKDVYEKGSAGYETYTTNIKVQVIKQVQLINLVQYKSMFMNSIQL